MYTVEPPLMDPPRSGHNLSTVDRQIIVDLAIYTILIENKPPRVDNLSTMDRICAPNLSIVERFHCVLRTYLLFIHLVY